MSDYDNPYGWEPNDDYSQPENIEPIYQQLLGHLASAHSIAVQYPKWQSLGRHIPHIEAARELVKEAAIHSASFLTGRAVGSLHEAMDAVTPVISDSYKDTMPHDYDGAVDPRDPAIKFHNHMSNFFFKAHKETGGSLPGEEGWDN
jgi:hypothetical protein